MPILMLLLNVNIQIILINSIIILLLECLNYKYYICQLSLFSPPSSEPAALWHPKQPGSHYGWAPELETGIAPLTVTME